VRKKKGKKSESKKKKRGIEKVETKFFLVRTYKKKEGRQGKRKRMGRTRNQGKRDGVRERDTPVSQKGMAHSEKKKTGTETRKMGGLVVRREKISEDREEKKSREGKNNDR